MVAGECTVEIPGQNAKPAVSIEMVSLDTSHEGCDGQKQPEMFPTQLSSRRELVEQLDSEPLFDYLVQNGALERKMVEEIKNEKSAAKVNLALLKHVEGSGKGVLNLFLNALRQTGQHHLANLLDEGKRIQGIHEASGYLGKPRHKGQVSLQIQVKALRLPQSSLKTEASLPRQTREWISMEDIKVQMLKLQEENRSREQLEILDQDEDIRASKSCFLCHCFSRLFFRQKHGKDRNMVLHIKVPGQNGNNRLSSSSTCNNSNGVDPNTEKLNPANDKQNTNENGERDTVREDMQRIAAVFQQKADAFYKILEDRSASIHTHLLKYFEQDRGVLVLDALSNDGLLVVNVCMRMEQLDHLRRDYQNGKLTKDLENCLVTPDVLESIGVKGIKLQTCVDNDEFDIAEQELS